YFNEGEMAQNLERSHILSNWEFAGEVENDEELIIDGNRVVSIAVHNSLKVGDEIEIVRPFYDIIKMKLEKMYDAGNREVIVEAHGGQKKKVFIALKDKAPKYSVIRRKL
ncbi:MAG: U32 family peptidase C-terminal domain-containing protein, partial [Candidatus Falkowbacteria bacterium]|nr:U32 family peptidase C-terminal domain-containing protein [Candidatus Falkowbacteria bacterium]